jgi:hypothetical protein
MTWCSEHSAVPGFVLAKSAIRCLFVDKFVGSSVPSHVSGQRVSTRGVPLPSAGSRRARFPDVVSTMEALRLPARVCLVPYGFGSRLHVFLLSFVLAEALPLSVEAAQQAWAFVQPVCPFPACCTPWARAGYHRFPGDPSYALALLQDPGRADKTSPLTASSMLPPGTEHRRPQRVIISRLTQGFSIRCLRFKSGVAAAPARLASG